MKLPTLLTMCAITTVSADEPLRKLADAHGIKIGAAVKGRLMSDERYTAVLAREFNAVTPENDLKFERVQPERGKFTFELADGIVAFAEKNGMAVRGHAFVWHRQQPAWIMNGEFSKDEWREILETHIRTVGTRYRGKIVQWDVVNEAIDDQTHGLRESVWLKALGPEYIEIAFRAAHAADPEARLFYNDYSGEGLGKKSDAIYELARDLKARGVPIHGIGLQMHLTEKPPTIGAMRTNMDRLIELGLEVAVTEMDVRLKTPATEAQLAWQAECYRDVLALCMEKKRSGTFVLWGFTDRYSWVPTAFKGTGAALIFDENFSPKPAYQALAGQLRRDESLSKAHPHSP